MCRSLVISADRYGCNWMLFVAIWHPDARLEVCYCVDELSIQRTAEIARLALVANMSLPGMLLMRTISCQKGIIVAIRITCSLCSCLLSVLLGVCVCKSPSFDISPLSWLPTGWAGWIWLKYCQSQQQMLMFPPMPPCTSVRLQVCVYVCRSSTQTARNMNQECKLAYKVPLLFFVV